MKKNKNDEQNKKMMITFITSEMVSRMQPITTDKFLSDFEIKYNNILIQKEVKNKYNVLIPIKNNGINEMYQCSVYVKKNNEGKVLKCQKL